MADVCAGPPTLAHAILEVAEGGVDAAVLAAAPFADDAAGPEAGAGEGAEGGAAEAEGDADERKRCLLRWRSEERKRTLSDARGANIHKLRPE